MNEGGGPLVEVLVRDNHFQELITVYASDTVHRVKKVIEAMIGVPPYLQLLFHDPKMPQLDDNKTLDSYNVNHFSELWLLTPALKMLVKLPQSRNILVLNIYSTDSVYYIKDVIREQMGIPHCRQIIIYGGKSLDAKKQLSAYDIPRNAAIHAVFGLDERPEDDDMQLMVENVDGEVFVIDVKKWFTILQVKAVIESGKEIPYGLQELVYMNKKLMDWKTVEDYKLKDKFSIFLNIVGKPKRVVVKPKTSEGIEETRPSIVVEASSSDTIDSVIDRISQEEVQRARGQPGLFLGDTRLVGNKTLAHYVIPEKAVLHLDRVIEINVLIPSGESIRVDVKASNTIYKVKERIEFLCGIFINLQVLTYLGEEVDDFMTLEQCEDLFGSLWILKWNWDGKTWSLFWPIYIYFNGE